MNNINNENIPKIPNNTNSRKYIKMAWKVVKPALAMILIHAGNRLKQVGI